MAMNINLVPVMTSGAARDDHTRNQLSMMLLYYIYFRLTQDISSDHKV